MAVSRGTLSVTPAPRDCTQDIVMVAVLKSVSVQRFSGKMLLKLKLFLHAIFAFVHLFCRTRDSNLSHTPEFTAERPLFEPSLDGVCVCVSMVVSLGRYKKSVSQRKVISVAPIPIGGSSSRGRGEQKHKVDSFLFYTCVGTKFYRILLMASIISAH